MRYRSKKDLWAAAVGLGIVVLFFALAALLFYSATTQEWSNRLIFSVIGGLLVLGGAVLLWCLLATSYEIRDEDLILRFGPFRKRIAAADVVEVVSMRRLVGPAFNLLWSLDGVLLWCRLKDGHMAPLPWAVSPADKEDFVAELARIAPFARYKDEP